MIALWTCMHLWVLDLDNYGNPEEGTPSKTKQEIPSLKAHSLLLITIFHGATWWFSATDIPKTLSLKVKKQLLNPFESFKTSPGIQAIHLHSPRWCICFRQRLPTPPKINIEPENDALVQNLFSSQKNGWFVGFPQPLIGPRVHSFESTDPGGPHHGELLTPLKATSHPGQAQWLGLGPSFWGSGLGMWWWKGDGKVIPRNMFFWG